jgi:hypothetical protein
MRACLFSLALLTAPLALSAAKNPVDFQVDLKNPVFKNGVLTTEEGGVITSEGVRIQAQKIEYTNRIENGIAMRKIVAEGDLLIEYADQAFVGKRLEYDFETRSGVIEEGRTHVQYWFLGGEKVYLQSDGSFYIVNAFITTWTSDDPLWAIHAGKIKITEKKLLTASDLRFQFVKLPLLWLPKLKANLKSVKKPPIRYKAKWDKKLGPAVSARYRVYSWDYLDMYLRGEYRIGKGGGLAFETEYESEDKLTEFVTRSWGSIHDLSTPIMHGSTEYRLQGKYKTESHDERTHFTLVYDKISSQKMISEFPSDDFEIDTKKRTYLFFDHMENSGFVDLRVQPRLNNWQSLNQELPSLTIGIRPLALGNSNVIMHNWTNASYLDYVYADDAKRFIHDKHAVRLQTNNSLYCPFRTGPVTWTPEVGIIAIFYNNDLEHHSIGQAIGTYGASANTRISRKFSKFEHVIEPYACFRGLTNPTASNHKVIIFSLKDGYHRIQTLRFGIVNEVCLLSLDAPPRYSIDLYSLAFFNDRGPLTAIPRLYTTFTFEYPTCISNLDFVWNIQKKLIDRINARTSWTVNDDVAFGLEFRHRSRFDWRKADHENYILDVSRSFHELLQSPLSDGRNTLLFKADFRIHPLWNFRVSSHFGWGRGDEPVYHSGKVDFFTTVVTGWRIRISAEATADTVRFDTGIELVKY